MRKDNTRIAHYTYLTQLVDRGHAKTTGTARFCDLVGGQCDVGFHFGSQAGAGSGLDTCQQSLEFSSSMGRQDRHFHMPFIQRNPDFLLDHA